ncbi:MAG: hypothetical protein Q7S05_05000 [bacterium]|nr:hypothetical protein [bacterium]
MNAPTGFWPTLGLLEALVVLGGIIAWKEGWLFAQQLGFPGVRPSKYLTYIGHAAIVALFVLTCPLQAWIIAEYGGQWDAVTLIEVLLVAVMAAALMQQGWIDDPVPSALVRDGLRMPGALNMASMGVAFAVAAMYYVPAFTPQVDTGYTWIVSVIFLIQVLAGILLPPLVVHGEIHAMARVQAIAGTAIIIGVHLWRVRY